MVAAAKLRRAQEAAQEARPYADKLSTMRRETRRVARRRRQRTSASPSGRLSAASICSS